MARKIKIAAVQVGAVHRTSPRPETLGRMLKLLEDAASQGAEVVLFPETTFTTFFPRYLIEDEAELESFFEHGDVTTAPNTKPLFDRARELGVDISVGTFGTILLLSISCLGLEVQFDAACHSRSPFSRHDNITAPREEIPVILQLQQKSLESIF